MVVFACGSCGDPIKKNQVEKHYQFKCRDCNVLSCIDCGKDFWGDSYKEHTKCISEEEKYSGKDFKPRPGANKGEAKQEVWFNQVQEAIDTASSCNYKLKELLERLKEFPNIPRKKAKFENFLSNSMRVRNPALVTQAWDAISTSLTASTNGSGPEKKDATADNNDDKNTNSASEKETVNGSTEKSDAKLSKRERKEERRRLAKKGGKKDKEETEKESKKSKKMKKKRKHEEDEDEEKENEEEADTQEVKGRHKKKKTDTGEEPVNKKQDMEDDTEEQEVAPPSEGTFKWESAIIGVLKRAPDNELSIKKLRKKVLCEYAARGGEGKGHVSEEKLLAKFQKKISKNPRLKIHKEKVKLQK